MVTLRFTQPLHWNNPWNHPRDLVSTVNSCSSLQSRGCRCTKGKGKVNRCIPFPSFVHALQPYLDCKRLRSRVPRNVRELGTSRQVKGLCSRLSVACEGKKEKPKDQKMKKKESCNLEPTLRSVVGSQEVYNFMNFLSFIFYDPCFSFQLPHFARLNQHTGTCRQPVMMVPLVAQVPTLVRNSRH